MGETVNWEKLFIGLLLPGPLPKGFIKLSQELRDKIYAEVFAAGHMALTRVSKAMNDDTKEALAKHGVYRARVTKDKLTQWRRQGRPSFCWQFMDEPSTSIRNLDILANHSPSSSFHGNGASCKDLAGLLPPLLDQMRDHVHCQVVLELPRHRSIAPEEVECLELLRIFKNVTIELCYAAEASGRVFSTYSPTDPMHWIDADTAIADVFNDGSEVEERKPKVKVVWGKNEDGVHVE